VWWNRLTEAGCVSDGEPNNGHNGAFVLDHDRQLRSLMRMA
jgi:hypothetical protein